MGQLAITNIINVSVSQSNLGINSYNTSNLGLFSDEVPANSFGTAGFKLYVEPTSVATDFGTGSKTFQQALAVFSQQPNILAGGGQLVVILMGVASETWTFGSVAASGTFIANFGGHASAAINWNDTAAEIQTTLQAVSGLSQVTVTGSIASLSLIIKMGGVYGAAPGAFSFTSNTLATSVPAAVTIVNTVSTPGESIGAAITRTSSLVQYFGIMATETVTQIGSVDVLAAAAIVQPLNKIAFWVSYVEADIMSGGLLDEFATGSFTKNRGLYYGDSSAVGGFTGINAMLMMAAYAGLGLSVNFSGSNTTITMNLKTLNTIQPDPTMSQTIYNEAKAAGADIYASIQGNPGVICFGANDYYDNVYNLQWFVGAILVASYNYLAQTSTKQPQTETAMDGFKGSQRLVCQQAVTNQFVAPGTWTNPTTFGVQAQFYQNIAQFGYYIYSQPIAQQSQVDRAARIAPLVQIAIKYAGAIQSADLIIYVNP